MMTAAILVGTIPTPREFLRGHRLRCTIADAGRPYGFISSPAHRFGILGVPGSVDCLAPRTPPCAISMIFCATSLAGPHNVPAE